MCSESYVDIYSGRSSFYSRQCVHHINQQCIKCGRLIIKRHARCDDCGATGCELATGVATSYRVRICGSRISRVLVRTNQRRRQHTYRE